MTMVHRITETIDQSSLVNAVLAAKDETIAAIRQQLEAKDQLIASLRQQIELLKSGKRDHPPIPPLWPPTTQKFNPCFTLYIPQTARPIHYMDSTPCPH